MRLNYQLRKWIMEKVEEYIKEHTNRYSNHVELAPNITGFTQWLTIDDARSVAQIAREETIKEVCEWIKYNNENGGCLFDGWENDLKKHLNSKV